MLVMFQNDYLPLDKGHRFCSHTVVKRRTVNVQFLCMVLGVQSHCSRVMFAAMYAHPSVYTL